MLSQVKLIAEPWDVGPGRLPGRQLPGAVVGVERHLPRRRCATSGAARPASASSPRASPAPATSTSPTAASRSPRSTSSPPTTASRSRDLVSYNEKHNEANQEDNRDGTDDNRSWNCGVEGPTDDPEINALRARQQRNFLATLLLSPGRRRCCSAATSSAARRAATTTRWCQDNEISWYDWELGERAAGAAGLHAAADRPAPRRTGVPPRALPRGRARGLGLPDVWWFRPDGRRMTQPRLGAAATARRSACSSTARRSPHRRRAGRADRRRLVPAAVQRRPRGRRCSRCPARALRRAAGRSS